jgi:hypothetical protein
MLASTSQACHNLPHKMHDLIHEGVKIIISSKLTHYPHFQKMDKYVYFKQLASA